MTSPENKTTVNLKSDSFVVIILLHEGLTHIHSQIKPRLHFGESFTLSAWLGSGRSQLVHGFLLVLEQRPLAWQLSRPAVVLPPSLPHPNKT